MHITSASSIYMAPRFSNHWPNPHPTHSKENTMTTGLITAAQARENVDKAVAASTAKSAAILESISERIEEASEQGYFSSSWRASSEDLEETPRVLHALDAAGYSVQRSDGFNPIYVISWKEI